MEALTFFAKKMSGVALKPFGTALILFAAAFLCRHRKTARWLPISLAALGIVWLAVASLPVVGRAMLHPLESRAGNYADPIKLRGLRVSHIVVLGAAAVTPRMSPADRQGNGIFQIMEGVRLWKELPESRLVISAGSSPDYACHVDAMAALPLQLGVPMGSLIIDNNGWDTEGEARQFAPLLGNRPFALVTSARHMPRSLMIFRRHGTYPVPCPCMFKTWQHESPFALFLPGATGLGMTEQALHEYAGILWLHVKDVLRFSGRRSAGTVSAGLSVRSDSLHADR